MISCSLLLLLVLLFGGLCITLLRREFYTVTRVITNRKL